MKTARISDVRPEFVFLGLLAEGPAHGYELYRRFREDFASLWHISESQMYATLKRLDARGWTAFEDTTAATGAATAANGAARRTVAITGAGRTAFEDWLSAPSAASPRALRLEFLTRLHFAARRGETAQLVASQRKVLESELSALTLPAPPPSAEIFALAADFRLRQVRAALEWLDGLNFS